MVAPPALALPDDVETITVTAERREKALQEVPLSVAVFSRPALDGSGVEHTADLPFVAPGVVFTTNSVLGQPYLRGVDSDLITIGADPSIAMMIDGIYQPRPVAAVQDFFDVKRVSLLSRTSRVVTRRPGAGSLRASQREAGRAPPGGSFRSWRTPA